MKEVRTFSYQQTVEMGKRLGSILKEGDVVCLSGDLGAGKTAFTSGIAKALGITGYITSPTFTLINEYVGTLPMYHFDVYRLSDPEEVYEIGFEEYIYGDGVVVIEWANLIVDILPPEYIWVDIRKDIDSGMNDRVIKVEFYGERYRGREKLFNS